MSNCDACGATLSDRDKNAAGHYRDRCLSCLIEAAAGRERHVDACEDAGCLVCASWREEYGVP
jgi:hypothetical protein